DQGDVDVIFRVTEKRTGNINFGASVGQGTGLGGFLGLDEPNLFGQGKRGRFQWQFGKNINDFDLSFTDPAFRDSRVSMTVGVHNTRLDRKSTRLNSSHVSISYAVFCLKKKTQSKRFDRTRNASPSRAAPGCNIPQHGTITAN